MKKKNKQKKKVVKAENGDNTTKPTNKLGKIRFKKRVGAEP